MNESTPRLRVEDTSIHRGKRLIIDRLNLPPLNSGFVAVVGSNGVGKSSLLEAIAGRIPIASGEILVEGISVSDRHRDVRNVVSTMIGPTDLPMHLSPMCYWQIVGWAKRALTWREEAEELSRLLGCDNVCDESIATLSFGTRMKVAVVAALLGSTPVVLLDEPFNGLDIAAQWALRDVLKERARRNGLILAVLHSIEMAVRHSNQIIAFNAEAEVLCVNAPAVLPSEVILKEEMLEAFLLRRPPAKYGSFV